MEAMVTMSCSSDKAQKPAEGFQSAPFGEIAAGEAVEIYSLTGAGGAGVAISNYGGAIVSLKVPDRRGRIDDVVLGFDTLEGYLAGLAYFGAIIGRYGNRIARGAFTLNGVQYKLATNNGQNHLHGGVRGFDKVVWQVHRASPRTLELRYTSVDGEEGYPGELESTVTYRWTESNELRIDYRATTDKDTVVNLTSHSYFNLKGHGEGEITDHLVTINADRFTPVNEHLIPTGELRKVKGTPFDFRQPRPIGERIDSEHQQIAFGGGYDHNLVLNRSGAELELAARVVEPKSGRVMEVLTTEPGLQFYTGNFLDGARGKAGKVYPKRAGFCMETQHFPDSMNQPKFPPVVLKPGSTYQSTTVYRFSVEP